MTSQSETYQNPPSRETKIQTFIDEHDLSWSEQKNFMLLADFLDYFIWSGEIVDLRGAR